MEIDKAIEYFKDAVTESDEIIADCSPAMQIELNEQKKHFVVALVALERQREIKRCMDNINKNPEPNEHIEGDTCEQYCGDCPHRICGRKLEG